MSRRKRILAVASGGGHWIQLFRLRPAFDGCDVTWATTQAGFREMVEADAAARGQAKPGYAVILDANRWQKLRLVRSLLGLAWLVLRTRPDVVITTGAAPGYFALRLGGLMGAKTVWLDSVANASALSLAGTKAGKHADLWLTQWPDLAADDGPDYAGAVL